MSIDLLQAHDDLAWPVPLLAREDLFTEKLLANTDRGLDRALLSRDLIDLAMMIDGWGAIPEQAWQRAEVAYGASVRRVYHKTLLLCCYKIRAIAVTVYGKCRWTVL